MNPNRSRGVALSLALAVTLFFTGCQTSVRNQRELDLATDPCASRLHDICGHLLLYYAVNKRLPQDLDGLRAGIGSADVPPLTCPVSGRDYLYHTAGLRVPGRSGRLVLYDASPAHSGMRWGIVIVGAGGAGPLSTRVILLPEERIRAAELQEKLKPKNRALD